MSERAFEMIFRLLISTAIFFIQWFFSDNSVDSINLFIAKSLGPRFKGTVDSWDVDCKQYSYVRTLNLYV